MCPTTKPLGKATGAPPRGFRYLEQQNLHSVYINTVAKQISGQGGPLYPNASFTNWSALGHYTEAEMQLIDPQVFDFRPKVTSPLVGAGVVLVPFVMPRVDGKSVDIGAYQHDDASPWTPGCSFHPSCRDI